jgi:phosphatidylglycerophosphatase A
MGFNRKAILICATGGYLGYIPVAPGTFGTLLGIPLCYLISFMPATVGSFLIIAFTLFAVYIAQQAEQMLKTKDPGMIVIDEIAGLMVTLFAIPFNLYTAVAGFVIFRILDIFKPFPIRNLERRLSGGWGVVLDDVVAGLMGNVILRVIVAIGS